MKTKIAPENIVIGKTSNDGRCPDYDEECIEVPDPAACFIGGKQYRPCCNMILESEPAKGYCPLIHHKN